MTRPHDGMNGLPDREAETLQRAIKLVRAVRDPATPGVVFLMLVAIAGAIGLLVTALALGGIPYVPFQAPHVVSGGFGGTALITVGALLAAVQAERADRARARREMQQVVDGTTALVRTAVRAYSGEGSVRTS